MSSDVLSWDEITCVEYLSGGGEEKNTLYCPFKKGFAGLTRGHPIVISRGYISTNQAQPLGKGVQHVFALYGRVLHDGAGAVVVAFAARAGPEPAGGKHRWRVQAVRVAVHGTDIATAGV